MRHGKKVNHLGRTSTHRKAMLANMAASLILHKRINTTLAKAKALRIYVEPLITKSKEDTTHSRRTVFAYIKDKFAVSELFRDISLKVAERPGGYTRIIKTGNRLGDNAEMAMIELVDYNEVYVKEGKTAKAGAKKSRRGGGAKKKADVSAPVSAVAADVKAPEVEALVVDAPVVEEKVVEQTPVAESTTEETPQAEQEDNTSEEKKD